MSPAGFVGSFGWWEWVWARREDSGEASPASLIPGGGGGSYSFSLSLLPPDSFSPGGGVGEGLRLTGSLCQSFHVQKKIRGWGGERFGGLSRGLIHVHLQLEWIRGRSG